MAVFVVEFFFSCFVVVTADEVLTGDFPSPWVTWVHLSSSLRRSPVYGFVFSFSTSAVAIVFVVVVVIVVVAALVFVAVVGVVVVAA